MRKVAFILAATALLALGACADQAAVTPAQQVYALESDFQLAERAIIAYEASPTAKPEVVAKIKALNATAHDALVAARRAVRAGDPAAPPAALAAAQGATALLYTYLRNQGVAK